MSNVIVKIGDLFESSAQTLVNTVNEVGVMGKGIALGFKKRYPDMYKDYIRRCDAHLVKLGKPYLYHHSPTRWILNFPTKSHWRDVSRLSDLAEGLRYLTLNYKTWNITSLAVPPLGCGNGQLDWAVVGPTLYRYLATLDIPVELFAPDKTPKEQLTLDYLATKESTRSAAKRDRVPLKIEAPAVAIVSVLSRISREQYRPPIGRISFQKIAYFLTMAGVPTGLAYARGSFGPYSAQLKPILARLINNGLVEETRLPSGRYEVALGPTYRDARDQFREDLRVWIEPIERVADLILRFPTASDVELGATAHYVANELYDTLNVEPTENQVLNEVMKWKVLRRPAVDPKRVATVIRQLVISGWIDARHSDDLPAPDPLEEFESAA